MTTYDGSRLIQYSPVLYITNKSCSVNHSTVMFSDCPGRGGVGHRIFSHCLIEVFNHTRFMLIPRPILEESLSSVYQPTNFASQSGKVFAICMLTHLACGSTPTIIYSFPGFTVQIPGSDTQKVLIFRCLHLIADSISYLCHVCSSLCMWLPMFMLPRNLILGNFMKSCQETLRLVNLLAPELFF